MALQFSANPNLAARDQPWMTSSPFGGWTPGQAMSPDMAKWLNDWRSYMQSEQTASAGNGNATPFTGSFADRQAGLVYMPHADGWQVYQGVDAMDSHDKSILNGRPAYTYDSTGRLVTTGTLQGLSKTREFGPLAQAGAILAAPFAVGGLQSAGLMGGVNPVLAAEGAGAIGGSAGTGALAGGAAGDALGAGAADFTMGGSAGAFTPATASEMAAMGVGSGGTAAMGAGAAAGGAMQGFNWSSLIGPATQLVGGALGAKAAGDASDAQLQAAREAQALSEPFRQGGMAGMNRLLDLLGLSKNTGAQGYGSLMKDPTLADFQASPDYEFRKSEQDKALTRSASASGLLGSGKYLKDAMRYSGDLASGEYGNWFNRFQALRQNKLNPLQSLMGAGQTAANTVGEYATQGGNAAAAGKVGAANAWTNALGQGVSMYNNQRQADQNNAFQNALIKRWGY